ncbi:DUF2306 domain-containing protein [Niveispirillum irakense]|uniref:DUF2306 domain-containing protein n=1 Tax=Niveispirillum irakense TaxID=34011 RepID=UPI00041BD489|nr:DUF2306 domain-containing protein [Niveispirillum irakense]
MAATGLAAFTAASPLIQIHAVLAGVSIALGGVQFAMPKGTDIHRLIGRFWVGIMAIVALSSFAIHKMQIIGPFSPIHFLSIFVLIVLYRSVQAARRGDIAKHRRSMILLYILGLIITGGFTLLPGRLMHTVLFGG